MPRISKGLCLGDVASEFRKERLDYDAFNHGKWMDVFGSSSNRCLKEGNKYLAFRAFEAVLMTAILIWSIIDAGVDDKIGCWPIFLTHWGLIINTAYFWFATYTVNMANSISAGTRPMQENIPFCAKAQWLLQDLAIPGSLLIVILYWALVVPYMSSNPTALSYFTHGVNFVLVLIDIFLSRQPYYLIHGIYIGIFGAVYLIFSLIYYAADGTDCAGNKYIYRSLDWNNAGSTATLGGILLFIVVPIWNLIFWFLISQFFPGNYQAEEAAPPPRTEEPELPQEGFC